MDIPTYSTGVQAITPHRLTAKEKTARDLKALRESCRDFEAIFVQQMYQSMRKNVPDDGLTPQNNATRMYQDMLDAELAKETAKGHGIGIGESMYNQMRGTIEKK